jgi:hypothetical protein
MIDPALIAAAVAEAEAEQQPQRPYPDQEYLAMTLREAEFERLAEARRLRCLQRAYGPR